VLRRFFGTDDSTQDLDRVTALLQLASSSERNRFVLKHICQILSGDVRGYVLHYHDNRSTIEALEGYQAELPKIAQLQQEPKARFFQLSEVAHSSIDKAQLENAGVFEAKSNLLIPVGSTKRYGVMVLHKHDGKLSENDLKLASQWCNLLGASHELRLDTSRMQQSLFEFTGAFVEAVEAQDFKQLGHARRVAGYALSLGRAKELRREQLIELYYAAMLHDIGKLGNGLEMAIEDPSHPERGANLLASAALLGGAREAIRSHHERWDGTGFPNKLKGTDIPLLARILSTADIFDFLSSERGHALPLHEVEKALENYAGRHLDPELVKLFKDILRQGKNTQDLNKMAQRDLF
jgi:HD-GYP domain-containing protein (c-di-GMP phosphodiesterase class II)